MKTLGSILAVIGCVLVLCQDVNAQRGGGPGGGPPGAGGGAGGPGGNGPPPPHGDRQDHENVNDPAAQGLRGGNRSNQTMPTVEELSQMLITNFDADGTGELNQAELQNALMALREMMQRMQGAQNQSGQNPIGQAGFNSQRNAFQAGPQNLQDGQGSRPPRAGGPGGGRRGR